ncbi:hypothetical protein GH714_020978 [Hevea brasiliensis]|uniref:Uncharacterized protein n=1 Tax=Hevea brasiliensis TaxID=3981 RepID=A0A6A6LQE2_HEVBR|nr:hypothetical protein GH714_020978 [Hevea brasiliensis]
MKPIDYETVVAESTMAPPCPALVCIVRAEPNHLDALEIARRLRTAMGRSAGPPKPLFFRCTGAYAVRGAPNAGIGPCLPARPVSKKGATPTGGLVASGGNKVEKPQVNLISENGPETKTQLPKLVLKPSNGSSKPGANLAKDSQGEESLSSSVSLPIHGYVSSAMEAIETDI